MAQAETTLPKYLRIAGHVRDRIVSGDLRPGDEVPSERELASEWRVARPTAARALEWLRRQGLVESRRGSGTFVLAPAAAPRARERYARGKALGSMYGADESVEFLRITLEQAPRHVTGALHLSPGAEAIRRARRIRTGDGSAIELSTSWFDASLATSCPALLVPERLPGGTARYVAEQTDRRPAYAHDRVAARLATTEEQRLLDLPEPSAVLVYWMTAFDGHDLPLQFDEAVYPQHRWTFHQEYALD